MSYSLRKRALRRVRMKDLFHSKFKGKGFLIISIALDRLKLAVSLAWALVDSDLWFWFRGDGFLDSNDCLLDHVWSLEHFVSWGGCFQDWRSSWLGCMAAARLQFLLRYFLARHHGKEIYEHGLALVVVHERVLEQITGWWPERWVFDQALMDKVMEGPCKLAI